MLAVPSATALMIDDPPGSLRLRVNSLLELRRKQDTPQRQHQHPEGVTESARMELLERLVLVAEVRNGETTKHPERVGVLSALVAKHLGFDAHEVKRLRRAATLHDIGKLAIPERILLKPGVLSPDEFEVMKTHTTIGRMLLANSACTLIRQAETIAVTHHERYDGSGYPFGLCGDEIPLVGQIVGAADVFDALLSQRCYKSAWTLEATVAELSRLGGRWFSLPVVTALLEVVAEHKALFSMPSVPLMPMPYVQVSSPGPS